MRLRFIYIVSYFTFTLISSSMVAQNLVHNGGFEDFVECPIKMSNLNRDAEFWSAPTLGTTDYFNECSKTKLGIPVNFKGKQEAYEGNGYAGLYLYAPKDYREYIQVPLSETLKKGHRYKLSLSLSLSEKSDGAVMDIGAIFSEHPLSIHTKRQLSNAVLSSESTKTTHAKQFSATGFYDDKKEWMRVSLDIVAKGFESILVLGNFKSNGGTHYLDFEKASTTTEGYSYYYLDDISLEYLGPDYKANQSYVLNHVNFDFDRFELEPKAKQSLKDVYKYLKKNPNLKVSISGHTDDLGSEQYNDVLSSQRAKTVAKYLMQLGLQKGRITYAGYGNKVPLDSTLSDKARRKNRRVEFVMTEFVDDE
ncbi:OmpA family protein [Flagellimonas hymeniacidonis]|uniref:OmpA family protein n=1 Tax=Flagellimonas hymeniacidonis TaxID=2603628 RepID=A0A5C8V340_9FLAO|nr:OmpA family protein [Flagellimonas hymeniacidonis]TXN34877.1 OmpA family protein [Flagellimonas hymeniacidonis]